MVFSFLLLLAVSTSGWGALILKGSQGWSRKFGAGSLVIFFLISTTGWLGLLIPAVLWCILFLGILFWVWPGRFDKPCGVIFISFCGLILLPLVALPPISRDAMIHHLYQARIWLEAERIVRPDWSVFLSYPSLTESLYTLAGGTFGFRISRAVSLLGFLASCSVLTGYFLRQGKKRAAILSLVVLLSIPELFRNSTWSYSDTFLVFFSLLAYLEIIRKDGNPILAVIWAGGASCCKYNGFLILLSVCILLPFYFRDMSKGTIFKAALAAVLTTLWWFLPNVIQWGNPVYPLLRNIFGPASTLSVRATEFLASNSFSTSLKSLTDYLLLPVRMSLHGEWNNPALFDGASGPLILAGTILALPVVKKKRRKFLLPLIYILLALVAKGQAIRTRYLLPGFAMLSIPISEALEELLFYRSRIVKYATAALITGCIIWSVNETADLYAIERPWEFKDYRQYISENESYYDFFQECRGFISTEDTTLLVNIGRPFYYPGYAIFGERMVPTELLDMFWAGMKSEEVAESLRKQGISHLAVDMFLTSMNVPSELSEYEIGQWREFVSFSLRPLLTLDNYVLFEIINETE